MGHPGRRRNVLPGRGVRRQPRPGLSAALQAQPPRWALSGRASRQGRRGYDAYELENRGAFMKRVREEQKGMKQKKKDELLSIAKMAGIKTKKKEGLYGKFDADDFDDEDFEDDLDLRVTGDD